MARPHRIAARVLGSVLCLMFVLALVVPGASVDAAQPLRITLDAGHGGREIGASYRFNDGTVLREKELTLGVAFRVRELLTQAGYAVTQTRSTDAPLNASGQDVNGDGRVNLADELQARVDLANRASSDLFVSIHFNGTSDPNVSGAETFWNPERPFADRSRRLAEQVQRALISNLRAAGYDARDRGAQTDRSVLHGDSFFLLAPQSRIVTRPSEMPAIIGEPLFLTNPSDATALRDDRILEAIARGYFDGIRAYAGSATPLAAAAALRAAAPKPTRPPVQPGWMVWAITYSDSPRGRQLAEQAARGLKAGGIAASVLETAQTTWLRPGFLIVTSGPLETRQAALDRAAQVRRAGYQGALVRSVPG